MNLDGPVAKSTTVAAGFGVTMPAWLPTLDEASTFAAEMVPILSAFWLAIQIIRFAVKWYREAIRGGTRA